ncbi:hypothetical protein BGZ60DRAFT_561424 [Tricladium varicosporioides]|nr:hypothetical protein BGZ60DRAFT_561424 [Hymenoscyphus varicosporioides]
MNNTTQSSDLIGATVAVKSRAIGWGVGIGIICFIVTLIIVVIVARDFVDRKAHKEERGQVRGTRRVTNEANANRIVSPKEVVVDSNVRRKGEYNPYGQYQVGRSSCGSERSYDSRH